MHLLLETLLQQELRHARQEENRRLAVAGYTQQLLQKRLEGEVQQNQSLSDLLEKQVLVEKQLRQEVMDLQDLLEQAQTAMSSSVDGIPNRHLHHRPHTSRHLGSVHMGTRQTLVGEALNSKANDGWTWPRRIKITSHENHQPLNNPTLSPRRATSTHDRAVTPDFKENNEGIGEERSHPLADEDEWSSEGQVTSELLVQSRDAFARLERETEELERSYRDIQTRLSQPFPLSLSLNHVSTSALPTLNQSMLPLSVNRSVQGQPQLVPSHLPCQIPTQGDHEHFPVVTSQSTRLFALSQYNQPASVSSLTSSLAVSTANRWPSRPLSSGLQIGQPLHLTKNIGSTMAPAPIAVPRVSTSPLSTQITTSPTLAHPPPSGSHITMLNPPATTSYPVSSAHLNPAVLYPLASASNSVSHVLRNDLPNPSASNRHSSQYVMAGITGHQPVSSQDMVSPVTTITDAKSISAAAVGLPNVSAPDDLVASTLSFSTASHESSLSILSQQGEGQAGQLSARSLSFSSSAVDELLEDDGSPLVTPRPSQSTVPPDHIHQSAPDHQSPSMSVTPSASPRKREAAERDEDSRNHSTGITAAGRSTVLSRSPLQGSPHTSKAADHDQLSVSSVSLSHSLHADSLILPASPSQEINEVDVKSTSPLPSQRSKPDTPPLAVGAPLQLDSAWRNQSGRSSRQTTASPSLDAAWQGKPAASNINRPSVVSPLSSASFSQSQAQQLITQEQEKLREQARETIATIDKEPKSQLQELKSLSTAFQPPESATPIRDSLQIQRQRDEEQRRIREEEAQREWQREQELLAQLERGEAEKLASQTQAISSPEKSERSFSASEQSVSASRRVKASKTSDNSDDGLDPAMAAYMKLVQQKKKEEGVASASKSSTKKAPTAATRPAATTGAGSKAAAGNLGDPPKDLDWGLPSDSIADELGSFGGDSDGSFDWG